MLDPHGREEVISTIERLNREMGITVVLITHHMTEAIRAQRVIVMDTGRMSRGRNTEGGLPAGRTAGIRRPDRTGDDEGALCAESGGL